LEEIAPLGLAQEWDNVGLLAGDASSPVRRVLLCIDLTAAVVDEAIAGGVDLIMAYHPPIFRPISRLHGHGTGTDAHVFRCVAAGIAVYSMHTALDAAEGGTNDVLAGLCGVEQTQAIEHAEPGPPQCKVVVFVPAESADKVAGAMFEAGAGHIGDYEMCSYRLAGEGTFRGSESTKPAIGTAGQFERVAELRIELVAPRAAVPKVIEAIRESHPYEEPAFDVYPLSPTPVRGIGRYGDLPEPITLAALARRLETATAAPCVQIVGDPDQKVTRAVICAGAAGSLPFGMGGSAGRTLQATDVIVTGEMRHHDALTVQRHGCGAITLGHWASERPALTPLAERLTTLVPTVDVQVSAADREPFARA
jgi:dinuclear metal center YbgI/SA1388 family protein